MITNAMGSTSEIWMHKSLALKEPCIHNDMPFFLTMNKQYQARPVTAALILKQLKFLFMAAQKSTKSSQPDFVHELYK